MDSNAPRRRALGFAMMMMGLLFEAIAIVLLASGRAVPAAIAVMIAGLMLAMVGIIIVARVKR